MESFEFRWGVRIRLRDGVHLSANLYLPRGAFEPAPCLLSMTPYVADGMHEKCVYFAAHGWPCLMVDVRGRGNSEGQFRPCIQEAQDAYDAIEWLAKQPCCNGQVAMWGGSYLGYCQWAAAKEFPPHLKTIVPTAAPYLGVEFPMRANIFYPFIMQWLTLTAGRASQQRIVADAQLWSQQLRDWYVSGRPFQELDSMLGHPSACFQEWLAHPEPDAYWEAHNPTSAQYARMEIPILTITGSYDDDQPGALEHYKQHMRNAPAASAARHYLVIGPWDHVRTVTPSLEFGGLKCAPASMVDLQQLHVEWYRWVLNAGPRPDFLQRRVAYYVMGAEHWRYADSLEEVTQCHRPYFLNSNGSAHDVFSSGGLSAQPGFGPPDRYVHDPADTRGPEVAAEANSDERSYVDQSVVLALRGKSLVYHSAPFDTDTEVSGFFSFRAWLAIDCPDTDFYVSVYEICLDGQSIRLSTDAMRARYREGWRTARLVQTREPLEYRFETFTFVSRQIKKGHRLRLVVAPIGRLIDAKFVQKNYNAGGVVSQESAAVARAVTVQLFHDDARPSALYVPLGRDA
jgi:hypothetical protein